ncbi:hypothetical protein KC19_2G174400 [Ceratodon purpureus]|uniref:NADH dehydrogenase subunit 4L n=1 Tax=Ceratodon purpureus TaxID=3225 RepID=A0A8T0IXU8_CERPU|nr:hypothetical protein KC19_2G174400 [Ceratodon purpureus]
MVLMLMLMGVMIRGLSLNGDVFLGLNLFHGLNGCGMMVLLLGKGGNGFVGGRLEWVLGLV